MWAGGRRQALSNQSLGDKWEPWMKTQLSFLDCTASMDKRRKVKCGLPAAVTGRYIMNSTDGRLKALCSGALSATF